MLELSPIITIWFSYLIVFNGWIVTYLSCAKLFTHYAQSKGYTLVSPEPNYIIGVVLELKVEWRKVKIEVEEVKKQLSLIHLSLMIEARYSNKSKLCTTTMLF